MNIIFITRSMWAGGAERVIAELAKHMNKKNANCKIITIDKEKVLYDVPFQVGIHAIGRMSQNKYIDKVLRYKELRKCVKNFKPDIVLTLPEDIGIFVIPALMGTNIPVVVSERNNPWVMPWKKSTRLMRKLFYPFASGFIFQTEQASNFFSEKIRKKGIVLPNPLDLNRIPEPWKGDRIKEIVGAGRLDKQKNFPLLIRAFAKFYENHSEYVLKIYGDGPLREELIRYADSLLPKNAYSFPGRTTELLEKIKSASMFVLSSDYEGMPNVVIEAMAVGIPVISTDCPSGGSSYLIENGKNGILTTVGDLDALSGAMSKIAESDEFAMKISKEAQTIKSRLNAEVVAEKWVDFLEEIYLESINS